MILTGFGDVIAARMRAEHLTLASRWLVRLDALLPVDAREIFSTNSLLDHVPALIVEIGDSLRESADGALAANTAIVDKARELGADGVIVLDAAGRVCLARRNAFGPAMDICFGLASQLRAKVA